jgi:large subunit ribosomal protein L24
MRKLRVDDPVMVIAGKFKWKISTIQSIAGDKVIVKWVNQVKKAMKGKGFLKKLLPIHISNIMYYIEGEKKPTKIKITVNKKWKKVRESKKFKTILK